VRESTSARGPLPRATGVIDSLSAGFGVVNEQPWIVLIPVLLDLFFLFGPRVSIAPIVSQVVTLPSFVQAFGAEATAPAIAFAEEANLLGLLSPGGLALPTIVPVLGLARGPLTLLDSAETALAIGLATILAGALLGSFYRALLAQQVRDGALSLARIPREAAGAWLRIVTLAVLLIVGGIMVIVPLAFVAAVASLVAPGATAVMTGIVAMLALAAQLYLFFAPDAIFVNRVGPIQAIRRSLAVVQAGAWPALTLALLITVILIGMGQVWVLLAGQASWGLALSIVGNAYIASGLVAASMLFYRERIEILLARRS
jgi:hypothetical protein